MKYLCRVPRVQAQEAGIMDLGGCPPNAARYPHRNLNYKFRHGCLPMIAFCSTPYIRRVQTARWPYPPLRSLIHIIVTSATLPAPSHPNHCCMMTAFLLYRTKHKHKHFQQRKCCAAMRAGKVTMQQNVPTAMLRTKVARSVYSAPATKNAKSRLKKNEVPTVGTSAIISTCCALGIRNVATFNPGDNRISRAGAKHHDHHARFDGCRPQALYPSLFFVPLSPNQYHRVTPGLVVASCS